MIYLRSEIQGELSGKPAVLWKPNRKRSLFEALAAGQRNQRITAHLLTDEGPAEARKEGGTTDRCVFGMRQRMPSAARRPDRIRALKDARIRFWFSCNNFSPFPQGFDILYSP